MGPIGLVVIMNNAFKGNIAPLNFEAWQEKEFEKLVKKAERLPAQL
ncbi:hypothetical protein JCM19235_1978 [Vibrio maritimus]|uniref:Uncharacterized protein n=1 Tax=Vibrio maritimus TaxID=990268 RepID=A0A090RT29_9VIBR|nr:hypothetical protein JCM19235_1978 [Vibrio maritimus]